MSRNRPSSTDSSGIVVLLEDITTDQRLKKDKCKIFLRDKKAEWNKSQQYLEENRPDKLWQQG